jgi:uracil phosphoribosyltransferase
MHTIIRDASISKNDFVFYADRINRLVVEAGLGLLPFSEKTVTTPTGHAYVGVDFARKLCGVSIIRSGEFCFAALRILFTRFCSCFWWHPCQDCALHMSGNAELSETFK